MQSDNTPEVLTPKEPQKKALPRKLEAEAKKMGLEPWQYFEIQQKAKEQELTVPQYMKSESDKGKRKVEKKAKKLGVTVEQFRKLDPDVARMKLSGKFPDCDPLSSEDCRHDFGRPCIHGASVKSKPLLNVPILPERILKLANEVINERYLLLLGKPELAKNFAVYLHKERLRQKMLNNKDPLVPALDKQDKEAGKIILSKYFCEIDCTETIPTDITINRKGNEIRFAIKQTAYYDDSKSGERSIHIRRQCGIYTIFMSDAKLPDSKPVSQFNYAIHHYLRKIYDFDILEKTNGFLIISTDCEKEDIPGNILREFRTIYCETKMSFDEGTLTVIVNGEEYKDLQDYEYKLLRLLYNNKGKIVSYDDIQKEAFNTENSVQQIQNVISKLRRIFDKRMDIENKRGVGYVITV